MKKFFVIVVSAFLLLGANGSSDVSEALRSLEKSISAWSLNLNNIEKRLSSLEENFKKKEIRLEELNHNNNNMKDSLTSLDARMKKIEKMGSFLEAKDSLKSLKATLDVLKQRTSEMAKRLEDVEVNAAALERIYKIASNETLPEGVKKPSDRIAKEEPETIVSKTEKKRDMKETIAKETEKVEKKQRNETSEKTASSEVTSPNELEGFKNIGNDFYVRNVAFEDYGPSSIVKGEIKNNSRHDFASASFIMRIFDEDNNLIAKFDFSVISIKSGEIKQFEETVSGVKSSEISKHKIVFKKSL